MSHIPICLPLSFVRWIFLPHLLHVLFFTGKYYYKCRWIPFVSFHLFTLPSSLETISFECGVWFLCIFLYFFLYMHIPINNIVFYTTWNFIWISSFSSLKSGLHSCTRTCLLLSRSLLSSMLLNPGNPLTPFSSSQQPERLEILSCGISEPGVLSYCLTPWAIFSIYFASFCSST